MATRKWDPIDPDRDVLRARFTVWLDTTLARASARYRDRMKDPLSDKNEVFSLDEIPEDYLLDPRDPYAHIEIGMRDFDFEEERLSRAFSELPLMRREVLRLLFVEQLTPREIAERLHCSKDFVSVQKTRALKKLRQLLAESYGDTYEK